RTATRGRIASGRGLREHGGYRPHELVAREWLLDECMRGCNESLAQHRVICVSGCEHDARLRPAECQSARKIAAAHPRHHEIRHHNGDLAVVAGCYRQSFLAVLRLDHAEAYPLEHPARGATHRTIVFNEEDGAGCSLRQLRHGGCFRRSSRHVPRKIDLERRTLPGLTVDPDVAPELLDDRIDSSEAESGTAPDLLGREERLEDLANRVRVHSCTGVRD